ncbi:MAG TPA: ABC transporter permease, partial [Candidatus Angelobacter sp.]|nr:ABC transporter permease [Candidatus Angelobacter sp.]
MKFLYLVWSNLKRKKLRTILTLLSILVAFVLFSLLSALKLALAGGVNMADANRLIVRHRVSFIQPLPYAYKARIARIPGVSAV